jgi:hypothetical protein
MENLVEIKSYIRDIKMSLLMSSGYKITLDISKQSDGLQFYSGTTRIMPQDVQLIIRDELPEFTQIGKTKLAELSNLML